MVVGAGSVVEDVHAVVALPVPAQARLNSGRSSDGQLGQIVVHPTRAGRDVELVYVAVETDEVDVLAVVASPIAGEAAACFRLDRGHVIAFHRWSDVIVFIAPP